MKNSVDKPVAAPNMPPPSEPKKQSTIRFGAIIPLAIVAGLISLYFTLFFDMHLRHGLEYAATQANGAEVNIGKLDTSVWKASVVVGDIQMTDPAMPVKNRVQIGEINFRMLWDALLRGKVVIDEASILDVQIDMPRKQAGRLVPVKPVAPADPNAKGVGTAVLDNMKQEFSGNVLGDLAAIVAGANPREQLAGMGGDLKSSAHLAALQASLEEKDQQRQARMAALPKGEDFAALQRRLTNVKPDNLQDATQLQAALQELDAIRGDFDAKSKAISETGTALSSELGALRSSYSGLDDVVKEDVRNLQAQMHLPSLDARTLSRALFGMDVLGRVQQARGYMDQARSYMPAKNPAAQEEKKKVAAEKARKRGHDYVFGKPNSYPVFWLRHAAISSRQSGELSGEILDMTSNPALVGRPMLATLTGNLPQQGISGIKFELVIDHTATQPVERLAMEVGHYAVAGRALVSSPNVELGFAKADGALKFAAQLRGDNVDVRMGNRYTPVAFATKAQSDAVREMMSAAVAGLAAVNLDAQVTGTWADLNWQISTNLANALENGMRRHLQGKMDEAKARIEALVHGKIDAQRAKLYARQGETEAALKAALADRQAQIGKVRSDLDGVRNKLNERKKALLGAQEQKLKQEADKQLDKLRKRF